MICYKKLLSVYIYYILSNQLLLAVEVIKFWSLFSHLVWNHKSEYKFRKAIYQKKLRRRRERKSHIAALLMIIIDSGVYLIISVDLCEFYKQCRDSKFGLIVGTLLSMGSTKQGFTQNEGSAQMT